MLATALAAGHAAATYRPPDLTGMVRDPSGILTPDEHRVLEQRLDALRRRSGYAVVVFFPESLEGGTIEDVAYDAFQAWKLGTRTDDNGVLLVLATREHRVRVETGKGVGGELTDIQSGRILQEHVAPHMKRQEYFQAALEGSNAIVQALTGPLGSTPDASVDPGQRGGRGSPFLSLIFFLVILGIVLFNGTRGGRSRWWGGGGWGGGGWGGGGDFGGGGGDGGGGGYSGGGGSSGGGGASDSY